MVTGISAFCFGYLNGSRPGVIASVGSPAPSRTAATSGAGRIAAIVAGSASFAGSAVLAWAGFVVA